MKLFSVIHIILFILFMLLYQCVSAQDDYLVTVTSDTVRGELRPMFFGVEKKVQVKSENDKTTYSILETKLYYLEDEFYYPVKGPYGYTFMKLEKTGYLSLLRFQPEKSSVFSGAYLKKADGTGIELPNLGFKKQMTEFLSDCENVSARIEAGELKKSDLETIIDEYNACIVQRTSDVRQDIQQHFEVKSSITIWEELEEKVNRSADFANKRTALEMIADVKNRISRGESVPNFIVEGLKSALAGNTALADPLHTALESLRR